ncbi:D-aminoacyl-tRNA deacylase [Linum perenne]
MEKINSVMKERVVDETLDSQLSDEDDEEEGDEDEEIKRKKRTIVEEEATHWPLDASDQYANHVHRNCVGSTDDYWNRQDAAEAIALVMALQCSNVPYGLKDDNVWVAHLLSGYSLPMDDPNQAKGGGGGTKDIGGTWKQSIIAAVEATRLGFPGGEILAHLDYKAEVKDEAISVCSFVLGGGLFAEFVLGGGLFAEFVLGV